MDRAAGGRRASPRRRHGRRVLERSVDATAARSGEDGAAYGGCSARSSRSGRAPRRRSSAPLRVPRHPLALARFGAARDACRATRLARTPIPRRSARAASSPGSRRTRSCRSSGSRRAAFGLVLGLLGHAVGWPFAARRSRRRSPTRSLRYLRALGGEIESRAARSTRSRTLPRARAVLFDVTPRPGRCASPASASRPAIAAGSSATATGPACSSSTARSTGRFRGGRPACARGGHGPRRRHARRDRRRPRRRSGAGEHPERPFVLVAQQSLFDPTRAPAGKHTRWAYCHVPERLDGRHDRAHRGADRALRARASATASSPATRSSPADASRRTNANYVGGDIDGGAAAICGQLFARPASRVDPYATPAPGLYLCSASTPPGGGVHGMCGYWAARAALRGPLRA